ncbi:MAG: methylated-DNA--[protein]-cysteine S-methyltransferase [Spirochaetaceae bacterium]|jgi:methylated-DNA-[protein]-cysteine S-methyltransferase|nr:methylated-DNA--[protein]-cysteine S-methyltransferase [Spirochaetaceae bacterium]
MKTVFFYRFPQAARESAPNVALGIAEEDGALIRVFFDNGETPRGFEKAETSLIKTTARQLAEYFDGKRKSFELPLAPRGTAFQTAVWRALTAIPYGETQSYRDIAGKIGSPRAVRAVGMANNRNPIVIIIPCHRVIGRNGSLTGYGGGLPLKQFLLDLERSGPS